jgi:outer membrane lipoprotein SlyB
MGLRAIEDRNMNVKWMAVWGACAALVLSGCAAPGLGGGDYGRGQVRGEQSVRLATVMSVRNVRIEGTHSGLGALTGAAVGGLAGHSAGGGRGTDIATVAGAVVGGLAGAAVEQSGSRQEGVEITVQYDNGRLAAITQGADEVFKVGDRVSVTSGGGVTRVTRIAAGSALQTLPPPAGSAPSPGSMVPPAGSAPGASLTPPPGSAPAGSGEAAPSSAAVDYRWYCPDKGYYPDVPTCTQKWLKVAP